MWVFCCGMMRSASTLQYQIAAAIVESAGIGEGVGVAPSPEVLERHRASSDLYVTKAHLFRPDYAPLFAERQAKAVYIYRDLRDVVVSWMNMQRLSFDEVMDGDFVDAHCLEPYYQWMSVDDKLVSRYEDLMRDGPAAEAIRIARYLGVGLDGETLRAIAARYTLDEQKKRIRAFDYDERGVPVYNTAYDPDSLLHNRHITSGLTNRWQTALTGAQVNALERRVDEWLLAAGYELTARRALERRLQQSGDREAAALFEQVMADYDAMEGEINRLQAGRGPADERGGAAAGDEPVDSVTVDLAAGGGVFLSGWHGVEESPDYGSFRWTGPETRSTVHLPPLNRRADLVLEFHVIHVLEADQLAGLGVTLNDLPVRLERRTDQRQVTVITGRIPPAALRRQGRYGSRLAFNVPYTVAPAHLLEDNADARPLGVAINRLAVRPGTGPA
jgi:hypothetical protein